MPFHRDTDSPRFGISPKRNIKRTEHKTSIDGQYSVLQLRFH